MASANELAPWCRLVARKFGAQIRLLLSSKRDRQGHVASTRAVKGQKNRKIESRRRYMSFEIVYRTVTTVIVGRRCPRRMHPRHCLDYRQHRGRSGRNSFEAVAEADSEDVALK